MKTRIKTIRILVATAVLALAVVAAHLGGNAAIGTLCALCPAGFAQIAVASGSVPWGLVPGVLLSLFVSFLLWQVISGSMTGLPFTLPWNYVALACVMTAVAVGASVAYGMHRCRADNVVEALRADAV